MQKQRQNLKNCLPYSGASQLNFQNKKILTKSDKRCEQTGGADSDNSERGDRKMSWRAHNIAPYPQHMTGILGPIEKYI